LAAVTAPQTARNVLTAVAVLAGLYVVWLVRDVVLLVVLALFVAVALSAPVGALQARLRLPRAAAIGLVYLLLLAVIVLIGSIVVPPLVEQVSALTREVPRYVQEIETSGTFERWDEQYHIVDELQQQAGKLPGMLSGAAAELETVTVGLFERAAEAIAVLAIAFLLLLDAPRTLGWLYGRLSPAREAQARRLAGQAAQAVGGYCAGVFAVASLAGLFAFVLMEVLGIPFSVPLAVQMAFFALLPLVGSAVGALIIAIVAAFEGPGTAVAWLVIFAVYQQLETHVLAPTVYRKTVAMRPVLVIVSVLVGASLLGILGALLAIPAAATIQIAVQEWWRAAHPEPVPQ
jgi:predicted PurR-regulated permease PerM